MLLFVRTLTIIRVILRFVENRNSVPNKITSAVNSQRTVLMHFQHFFIVLIVMSQSFFTLRFKPELQYTISLRRSGKNIQLLALSLFLTTSHCWHMVTVRLPYASR